MKYRAFIDFTHNGVKIKGGEVFDSDEVKFSIADINFLKEQSKIELARPLIKLNQNSINEDIVKPEEIPVETKEIIKETMVQDESPDLKEEIAEEVIEELCNKYIVTVCTIGTHDNIALKSLWLKDNLPCIAFLEAKGILGIVHNKKPFKSPLNHL